MIPSRIKVLISYLNIDKWNDSETVLENWGEQSDAKEVWKFTSSIDTATFINDK